MTNMPIQEMFKEYDTITKEIATVEFQIKTGEFYPSQGMNTIIDLEIEKWNVRRRINSAFIELERKKPLWKRIFKK